ncbi:TfuA-like protein [Bradyrhizobium sp. URHA0013]|jgi:hypothetical protein|uniref:TfuA-like protein n=1 Tax=Bradyrhizobium sp. URHA0013 TaxID=1380352 RepID=UPI0009DD7E75|nr:TfuA-like protein [Bradyrhizobium sp. URHA0013]
MSAIIFAGPSLPPGERPTIPGIEWRPPVLRGDLYLSALRRPDLIGVVDGYFETVPTVWHKEILWAMSQGIHVYGAGSIGALRAAELAEFGMIGVGDVYRQFRTGELTDDEEIAVLHGPAEVEYLMLTEAMVNVRATVNSALRSGIVQLDVASALIGIAKALFYKDRTYDVILKTAAGRGLAPCALDRFAAWLPCGQVDQKRMDAQAMLRAMIGHLDGGVVPLKVSYQLAKTFAWEEARRLIERTSGRTQDSTS